MRVGRRQLLHVHTELEDTDVAISIGSWGSKALEDDAAGLDKQYDS
jgi:hypothetical protein